MPECRTVQYPVSPVLEWKNADAQMAFNDDCVVDPHPDLAFYLPTDSDLDPGQTLLSLKVDFLHEKYTYVGNRS